MVILERLWSLGHITNAFPHSSMNWMSCWQIFDLDATEWFALLIFHLFLSLILFWNRFSDCCIQIELINMKAAKSSWKYLFFHYVLRSLDTQMTQPEVHNELTRCSWCCSLLYQGSDSAFFFSWIQYLLITKVAHGWNLHNQIWLLKCLEGKFFVLPRYQNFQVHRQVDWHDFWGIDFIQCNWTDFRTDYDP